MSGVPPRGGAKSCSVYAMAQDYDININVKGLGAAAQKLADFTDELNEARAEGASVSGALDKATGGAVTGFRKAAAGAKTFIAGLKLTRAAIIATGVGALVIGVTALVSAFTKTRKGARQLKQVMAGLSAGIEFFTTRIQAAGGFLVNLFTKGRTAAVQEFNEALEGLDPTLDGAIRKAVDLEKATQALTDAQRDLTVQRAKDRAEIKELNMVAEDVTKTLKERETAAKRAIDIEKGLMAERERIAAEELRIAQEKAAMSDSSDEDLDRLAELEANLINIRTESVELQTTLNNKLNTIRAEAARKAEEEAKRVSDAADAKKKADQDAADAIVKAEQEVIDALDARDRATLDARTKEILALEDFYNTQLDKAGENAELVAQIETQREEELAAMRERFRMEDAAKAEEARKAQAEADEQARQENLDREREALTAEMNLKKEVTSNTFSIISNLNKAFSKQGEEQSKKSFERTKAISIAETLVSTYLAAQAAFASQFKPLATIDSPVRGALAAGAAVAGGLARVAAIKSQQFNGGGGGSAAAATGGGFSGTASVGVDVGSLIPNQQTPTPEPVRAYVVENEISNKQALNRELQIQTTL
jgi:chemotaxis protein histidine kinase CheA